MSKFDKKYAKKVSEKMSFYNLHKWTFFLGFYLYEIIKGMKRTMHLCPLCNGLGEKTKQCPNCQTIMQDVGKVTDYFDDYSAYMDIEIMKLYDGHKSSLEDHLCLHYFLCPNCQRQETDSIQE